MEVFDTSFLEPEGTQAPRRTRRWILVSAWASAMIGAGAVLLLIALHVAPAAGAAGGCGGG